MLRWTDFSEAGAAVAASGRSTVVGIGNFDGVHLGHRAVLSGLVVQARRRAALAVAITFEPHPLAVLFPDRAPAAITGLDHKLDLMAETGLDAVAVIPFTKELAGQSPELFVKTALVDALRATVVVVGHDMRFGHRNSGDVATLQALGVQHHFEVVLTDDLGSSDDGSVRRWSSTWVRELLSTGEVKAAAEVLGRRHRVSGVVVHGDHRGRTLGFPTANLDPGVEGMVPADGVYAGWLVLLDGAPVAGELPGRRLPAAVSVGTNPTFDGHQRRVEAYVLDRDDLDLYGRRVGVEFVAFLRPTLRFDGVEPLVSQMHQDVATAREVLRSG